MRCIQMRYRGMTFPVNAQSLAITCEKKTAALPILKRGTRVQEVGHSPTVISGSGRLTGADAEEQANRLMRLFGENGAATLFCPVFPPLRMFFTQLQLTANAAQECIDFTFRFVEEYRGKKSRYSFGYTFARAGETLYDIANRCEIPVEELFALNAYPDLFSVSEGDRVWLK